MAVAMRSFNRLSATVAFAAMLLVASGGRHALVDASRALKSTEGDPAENQGTMAPAGSSTPPALLQTTTTPTAGEVPTEIATPEPTVSGHHQWMGPGPAELHAGHRHPQGDDFADEQRDDDDDAEPSSSVSCPGPLGLMGGWSVTDASSASVDNVVQFVLSLLQKPANTQYVIKSACTQVVAGTKFFVRVSFVAGGGGFSAIVFQPLPSNASDENVVAFELIDLAFSADNNNVH